MVKNKKQLLEEIKKLSKDNKELYKKLPIANKSMEAIKAGNIDALIISHKNDLKIYTEQKVDNLYRILIEKMHEGAVTLNKDGIILYSNSSFANMVGIPLQKVPGETLSDFIDGSSKQAFKALFKKGWKGYSQDEVLIRTEKGIPIPVLMSVNTLLLENNFVLSIILTDLSLQTNSRAELKSVLVEKIINVIAEMNLSDKLLKVNFSEYISKKLNHRYSYLASIFLEGKGMTIQQFILIQKIEKIKELLLIGELNLSEISYQLKYCSVAHLSNQFKKITGISPTHFKQIKQKAMGNSQNH